MYETRKMPSGGYRFIPSVFQYSGGVSAIPGYVLERVQFSKPLPIDQGFKKILEYLSSRELPLQAFCGCELRSPAPFTDDGFRCFNETYIETLANWGILKNGTNPVARSNVCPEFDKPEKPSFHAFTHSIKQNDAGPTFVISGSGEVPEGKDCYQDHIVARDDLSPKGLMKKVEWVLGEMERRLNAFNARWKDTTTVQVYTVHDIHHLYEQQFASRGITRNGFMSHLNRPPVVGLEYEMDCRRLITERILEI